MPGAIRKFVLNALSVWVVQVRGVRDRHERAGGAQPGHERARLSEQLGQPLDRLQFHHGRSKSYKIVVTSRVQVKSPYPIKYFVHKYEVRVR